MGTTAEDVERIREQLAYVKYGDTWCRFGDPVRLEDVLMWAEAGWLLKLEDGSELLVGSLRPYLENEGYFRGPDFRIGISCDCPVVAARKVWLR